MESNMKKGHFVNCIDCNCREAGIMDFCSVDELQDIADTKNCNVYKKGQVVFSEGNHPFGIHCLNEGKVKLTKISSDGKEQIVRLAKPGDVLGYRAMIAGDVYNASAVALEDTKVCFIPNQTFFAVLEKNISLSHNLTKLLATVLGSAEDKIKELATKPVRERLAEALLLVYRTYAKEKEEEFTISLSREDLASIVGTAKETVIRFLSEFKEEQIVKTQGSKITILNVEALQSIVGLYD